MTKSLNRILAIALKEWRLNLRFPIEFLIGSFVSPIKSAVLMCLLYSGFFKGSAPFLGNVTKDNYIVYVLLGTILHGQFSSAIGTFRGKMMTEKYWQTATATFFTPVSIFEVIGGFIIGSGGIPILANTLILTAVTFFYPIQLKIYLLSLLVLALLAFLGFAFGLLGATIGLCWEGKSFLFEYFVQGITFLSCFYFPIQLLPRITQNFIRVMPTYQLSNALHELYMLNPTTNLVFTFGYMIIVCLAVMIPCGILFDYSVRKNGIVGY